MSDMISLSEERERMEFEAKNKGCTCALCGQFVKVYKRKITSTMAKQLILAHKKHGADVGFHIRDMSYFTTDWAVLQHFDLIKPMPHQTGKDGLKASGSWKITEKGDEFVTGNETVPKYALVYNARRIGWDGEDVNITSCLGQKFDYNDLMKGD